MSCFYPNVWADWKVVIYTSFTPINFSGWQAFSEGGKKGRKFQKQSLLVQTELRWRAAWLEDKRRGINSQSENFEIKNPFKNFGQERNGGFPQLVNEWEIVIIHTGTRICSVFIHNNQLQRRLFCNSVCLSLNFPAEKCEGLGHDSFLLGFPTMSLSTLQKKYIYRVSLIASSNNLTVCLWVQEKLRGHPQKRKKKRKEKKKNRNGQETDKLGRADGGTRQKHTTQNSRMQKLLGPDTQTALWLVRYKLNFIVKHIHTL